MLRIHLICLLLSPFFFSKIHESAISHVVKSDTCFYTINVPPDIDFPETPHFDTTIIRNTNCSKQFLKLPGWGTETKYSLMSMDSVIHIALEVSFTHDQRFGLIDITGLPAGVYGMGLLACNNGGAFTIHLK